ncbi:MAG TPA: 50S ribosomal protein L10 [Candidatus Omnitrophota bacterium]|nr:50S ribosomal protein L10 [Candidatus Omnitrophota bacterium]
MAEKYGKKVREMMIKEMESLFSQKRSFIFSSFDGTKAKDIDAFRKKINKVGCRYMIVKKQLGKVALKKAGFEGLEDAFTAKKNVGVTLIEKDPVIVAKILTDYAKENEKFQVVNGCLEGQVLTSDKVKALASLPSREQLIAKALGSMNAPITNFVGVLAAVLRSVCYALNAVKDKKQNAN